MGQNGERRACRIPPVLMLRFYIMRQGPHRSTLPSRPVGATRVAGHLGVPVRCGGYDQLARQAGPAAPPSSIGQSSAVLALSAAPQSTDSRQCGLHPSSAWLRAQSRMGTPLAFPGALRCAGRGAGLPSISPHVVCVALPLRVHPEVSQAGAARRERAGSPRFDSGDLSHAETWRFGRGTIAPIMSICC